jgi:uncharacterized membrane protein
MDQQKSCLKRSNSARELRLTKCDQELGFIVGRPKLVPEYNLYKVPDPAKKSNFQTKFEAFKNKVYVDKTEAELRTFFKEPVNSEQLKTLRNDSNYLQNLSAARKRTYLDFKYISAKTETQRTEEQFIIGSNILDKAKLKEKITALKNLEVKNKTTNITKAIINNMLGNTPVQKTKLDEKEKEKLKFALNILNYENEILRGNINNRLDKKEYKVSTTKKITEQNFEGYIDNQDNVYADKGFLNLNPKLIKALKTFKNDLITEPITNTLPLPVGQEIDSQAKLEKQKDPKIETYITELRKPGSHKRELLKTFDEKNLNF